MAPPNTKEFNEFSIKVMTALTKLGEKMTSMLTTQTDIQRGMEKHSEEISEIKEKQATNSAHIQNMQKRGVEDRSQMQTKNAAWFALGASILSAVITSFIIGE